jgi:hypothetical protein
MLGISEAGGRESMKGLIEIEQSSSLKHTINSKQLND